MVFEDEVFEMVDSEDRERALMERIKRLRESKGIVKKSEKEVKKLDGGKK